MFKKYFTRFGVFLLLIILCAAGNCKYLSKNASGKELYQLEVSQHFPDKQKLSDSFPTVEYKENDFSLNEQGKIQEHNPALGSKQHKSLKPSRQIGKTFQKHIEELFDFAKVKQQGKTKIPDADEHYKFVMILSGAIGLVFTILGSLLMHGPFLFFGIFLLVTLLLVLTAIGIYSKRDRLELFNYFKKSTLYSLLTIGILILILVAGLVSIYLIWQGAASWLLFLVFIIFVSSLALIAMSVLLGSAIAWLVMYLVEFKEAGK